jgi:RNA polymerase sigma-70 factor
VSLVETFLAARPSYRPSGAAALAPVLEALVARGVKAWPRLALDPHRLVAALAASHVEPSSSAVHAEDLWLTCACVARTPGAMEAFDAHVTATLAATVARSPAADREDLLQALRLKLFTGSPVGLANYSGTGSLQGWVRVAFTRLVLNGARRRSEELAEDGELLEQLSPQDDPEVVALKRELKGDFRRALGEAFLALTSRERALLRQTVLEQATVDELAQALKVPRSTAGRQLKDARDHFAAELRAQVERQFGVASLSARQMLDLVESQLEQTWLKLTGVG